jgi:DNA-binding transcriptional LysR family regulator
MNPGRFDLTSLRLFTAAVEGGSLTAAAARIGISVAAASKRVSELEEHIGSTLLTRSRQGVTPTQAGRTLYSHAVVVTAGVEQLSLAMGDFSRGVSEHLRLWGNTSAFSGFLPAVLAQYASLHPEVMLDLEDALSEDIVAAVAEGRADLGVVGANTPTGHLETEVCHVDELVLVVPLGHPLDGSGAVTLARGLEHDLITLHRKTSLMRQVSALAEARGAVLAVRAQVRDFDAMCRMVAAGLGIAIMPSLGAQPHLGTFGLRTVAICDLPQKRKLALVMRNRQQLSRSALLLVELIRHRRAG